MRLNIVAILQLIEEKFRGNESFFAETIGVDRSYLNKILHKKVIDHSPKVCLGVIKYCMENNLNCKNYIFLT